MTNQTRRNTLINKDSTQIKKCFKDEPGERTHHSMTTLKQNIFVYGGFDSLYKCLYKDIWKFDIYKQAWSKILVVSPARISFSYYEILAVGKKLYVFGCKGHPFDIQNANYLAIYDTESQIWDVGLKVGVDEQDPENSLYNISSLFYYDRSIYILAVTLRDITNMVMFKYDTVGRSWCTVEQKGQVPNIMYRSFGTVFGNRYYCFGENKSFRNNNFNTVHIFDMKTNEWIIKETFADFDQYPADRVSFSISFNQTHGYISGGMGRERSKLGDLWSIDLRTLQWHKFKQNLETKIMGHTSCIYDEKTLYIFGGMDENGLILNSLQKYYLEPPPLYKLSFLVAVKNNEDEVEELPFTLRNSILFGQNDI